MEQTKKPSLVVYLALLFVTIVQGYFSSKATNIFESYIYWTVSFKLTVIGIVVVLSILHEVWFSKTYHFFIDNKPYIRFFLWFSALALIAGLFIGRHIAYQAAKEFNEEEKRLKVLILPFQSDPIKPGYGGASISLDIRNELIAEVKANNLESRTVVEIFDETEPYKSDVIDRTKYTDDEYVRQILEKTQADLLIYGARGSDDSIVYCWQTGNMIKASLDTGVVNAFFTNRQHQTNSIADIRSGKITGCTKLTLLFSVQQLDYYSRAYDLVYGRFVGIRSNRYCKNCGVYFSGFILAGQAALKLKNDSLLAELTSAGFPKRDDCNFEARDSALYYSLLAWFHLERDKVDAGVMYADSSLKLFPQRDWSSRDYLQVVMLKAYGLNKLNRIDEAISVSKGIISHSVRYPELALYNYSNMAAYYGLFAADSISPIDSSFKYLKIATDVFQKSKSDDSDAMYIIWNNYLCNFYTLKYTINPDNKRYSSQYIEQGIAKYSRLMSNYDRLHQDRSTLDKSRYQYLVNNVAIQIFVTISSGVRDSTEIRKHLTMLYSLKSDVENKIPNSQELMTTNFVIGFIYDSLAQNHDSCIRYGQLMLDYFRGTQGGDVQFNAGAYQMISRHYLRKYQETHQKNFRDSTIKYTTLGIDLCSQYPQQQIMKSHILPSLKEIKGKAEK